MFYTSLLIIALAVTTSKVQATSVPFNGKVDCTSYRIVDYLRPYYENRLLLMILTRARTHQRVHSPNDLLSFGCARKSAVHVRRRVGRLSAVSKAIDST
jgi:hypothetical protein